MAHPVPICSECLCACGAVQDGKRRQKLLTSTIDSIFGDENVFEPSNAELMGGVHAAMWKHCIEQRRQQLVTSLSQKMHESAIGGNLEDMKSVANTAKNQLFSTSPSSNSRKSLGKIILQGKFRSIFDHKDSQDFDSTPLLQAASRGYLDEVKLLVDELAADITARRNDHSKPLAIHLATENGHIDVVKFLLENGDWQLEATTRYNETPLNLAAYNGHRTIVEYLIDKKNANIFNRDTRNNWTPLTAAASRGHIPVVDILTKFGAEV